MIVLNLLSLTEDYSNFNGCIPVRIVAERVNSDYFNILGDALYGFKIRKSFDYFEFKGNLQLKYEQMCGRCADFKPRELDFKFEGIIKFKVSNDMRDDVGIYYAESEVFNLEELLLEQLVLHLDPFWLPEVGEGKMCAICRKSFDNANSASIKNRLFEEGTLLTLKKIFTKY